MSEHSGGPDDGGKLSEAKVEAFAAAYRELGKATKAARKALGWSKDRALAHAGKVLKRPDVQAAIARQRDAAAKAYALDRVAYLKALDRVAFFDPADMYGPDGALLPVHQMPERARLALQAFEENHGEHGTQRKVKSADRLGAIKLGLQQMGELKERELTLNLKLEDLVNAAGKPPAEPEGEDA